MIAALLVGLACESAQPLPPPARASTRVASQMVAAGDVHGYLVRTEGSTEAVLLLSTEIDEGARQQAKGFTGSTVLAITPATDTTQSESYLKGLPGIETVTTVCARQQCPGVIVEVGQSSSPPRQHRAEPGQPSDRRATGTADR